MCYRVHCTFLLNLQPKFKEKIMFKKYSVNEFLLLLVRFLLVLFLFSLSRFTFFWFNSDLFGEISLNSFLNLLIGGVRFDLSALLYLNSIFLLLSLIPLKVKFSDWYQTILKWLFFITNGIALAANVSDTIYYRFTLKRTTASIFEIFANEENMGSLWLQFVVDYWYAGLLWGVFMLFMIFIYNRFKPRSALNTFGWKLCSCICCNTISCRRFVNRRDAGRIPS